MIHDPNDAGLPDELPTPSSDTEHRPAGDDAPQEEALHRRRIRSFVTRAGRVSTGQRRAIRQEISATTSEPTAMKCPHSVAPIAAYQSGFAGALKTAKREKKKRQLLR